MSETRHWVAHYRFSIREPIDCPRPLTLSIRPNAAPPLAGLFLADIGGSWPILADEWSSAPRHPHKLVNQPPTIRTQTERDLKANAGCGEPPGAFTCTK